MNEIPLQVVNEPQNTVDIPHEVVNQPKKNTKFQKGNKLGGKPVGAVSYKTRAFEELGLALTSVHADTFNRKLSEMMEHNPEKGMYIYLQVLEYFKPKLNRTTLSGDADNPVFIAPAKFE